MRPRHYRVYSQPQDGFWCCVGSGMENHTKYGELIYAHSDKDLYVNLFIPSTLTWKEKGITVKQTTQFPFTSSVGIELTVKKPGKFIVYIRYPSWVRPGSMVMMVNKKRLLTPHPDANGYVAIERTWKSGDYISFTLPREIRVEHLPDNSPWVAFLYGPIVLAAKTDTTDLTGLHADDSRMGHVAGGSLYPIEDAPILLASQKDLEAALKPVEGEPLTFTASSIIYPGIYKQLKLIPFFQLHDARYIMYWPVSTPEEVEKKKQLLRQQEQAKLALEARTVDRVTPGEQQPESDHNFRGERSESGVFSDRHFRHASGWFSYDLKNRNHAARTLRITYFGRDNRHFEIYCNDQLFKTIHLDGQAGDKFVDVDYPLPQELINLNTELIRVKFVAQQGSMAGGIYDVRLLK